MSHHTVLLDEFATFLAAHDVAEYQADGFYPKDVRGITVAGFPETPADVVALSLTMPEYTRLAGGGRRLTASHIQIRTRLHGSPLATVDLLDQLTYLIDRKRLTLGPLRANGAFRSVTAVLPTSGDGWVQSSNWTLTALEGLPT